MKNTLIFLFIVVLSCNCRKEPPISEPLIIDNDIVVNKPYIWKTTLTDGDWIGSIVQSTILADSLILLGSTKQSKAYFSLVNFTLGKVIREYPCFKNNDYCLIYNSYQYKNNLIFQDAGTYCLNIENGNINWQTKKNGWFWFRVTGIDSLFFVSGQSERPNNPYKISSAYFGKINSGEITEFLYPDLGAIKDSIYVNGVGGINYLLPYKSEFGDILLVVFYAKFEKPSGEYFFGLYNFSKRYWVYEKKKFPTGFTGLPIINNKRIYCSLVDQVCCVDIITGETIWSNKTYGGFSSDGFAIGDGNLVALCEGTYPKSVIAYNLETGAIVWKTDSHGTISPMRYLNGVVYFASTGDGRLHAIDAKTGKYLWHIKSPDLKINSGGFFKPECNVIPGKNGEKGKVIVSSYFSGICYEAER